MTRRRNILSVIIATRNRYPFLKGCLDALASLGFDRARHEVLVVDNGSTDETEPLLREEAARPRLPLRRVSEPRTGLATARNTGVERAEGDFLVFLDDDALVAPSWLNAFERDLRVNRSPLVQGRIVPRFPAQRPAWLADAALSRFGALDEGNESHPLRGEIHGGNLGVARSVFDAAGLFRTDLGAGAIGLGEDTEFGRRAAVAGFRAAYAPDALIYHLIPRERATRSAFLRRCYRTGLSQPLFKEYPESTPRTLLSLGRAALERTASAAFTFSGQRRMDELCRLAEHVGRVRQILRMRARG